MQNCLNNKMSYATKNDFYVLLVLVLISFLCMTSGLKSDFRFNLRFSNAQKKTHLIGFCSEARRPVEI